jgi:hypothetical protein
MIERTFNFEDENIYNGEKYFPGDLKPNPSRKAKEKLEKCNLCNEKFYPVNRFERFCTKCKQEDDLYLNWE